MDRARGYVRNWRAIDEWQWYTAPHHAHVFQHLIRKANRKDKFWQGIQVRRGQLLTSQDILAGECGVSRKVIRTIVTHLSLSGEIRCERASQRADAGTIITITNYDTYQSSIDDEGQPEGQPRADEGPTRGRRGACNNNPEKPENPKKEEKRRFSPPTIQEVAAYAAEKGYPNFDAQKFVESYAVADWHDSQGNPVRNWKQKFLMVWAKRVQKSPEVDVGINFDNLTHELSDQEAYEDAIRFERPWTKEETLEARAVIGRGEKWVRTRVPAFEEGPWTYDPSEA